MVFVKYASLPTPTSSSSPSPLSMVNDSFTLPSVLTTVISSSIPQRSWKRYCRRICSPFYCLLLLIGIIFLAVLIISRLVCAAHFTSLVHGSPVYETIICTGGIISWSNWLRHGRILPIIPELSCSSSPALASSDSSSSSSYSSYVTTTPIHSPTDGCLHFQTSMHPPVVPLNHPFSPDKLSASPPILEDSTRKHRVCGIWALIAGGFHGRTGNAMIQYFAQQFLADSLNYLFVTPSEIGEVGTVPEYFTHQERSFTLAGKNSIPSATCPIDIVPSLSFVSSSSTPLSVTTTTKGYFATYTFPRSWTGTEKPIYSFDDSFVYSYESFNTFVQLFRDFQNGKISSRAQLLSSLPRLLTTSWFWERGDILTASLERFVPHKVTNRNDRSPSEGIQRNPSLSSYTYLPN